MRRWGLIVLVTVAPLSARHDVAGCGTTSETSKETLFLHRQARRARLARGMAPDAAAAPGDRDIGNIAIIEDTGGVVERLNQFNLDGSTLTFTPSAAGATRYRFTASGASYDSTAAQGTPVVALGDDDWRQFTLPFAFPFYGATYSTVFLNSDGNLTFVTAESASTARTIGRVTGGPPRIAALFEDLDPSVVPGGVRYLADATHAVFTWVKVPEYSDFGIGLTQTFQVRLYAGGRVEFAYNGVSPTNAVVGIAPGNVQGATSLVSFHNDPSGDYPSAVVEFFANTLAIDIVTVAQRFYQTHEDAYDYLVIYNNMGVGAIPGALAYESTVRSASTGHGVPVQDTGSEYGSGSRLRSIMNMAQISQYPLDPAATVPARAAAHDTPLTVLGHEAGHLFNAFASIRDPNDPTRKPMLGYGGAHWSFLFNSEASLDEGEQILDLGPDAAPRFLTAAVTQGYSPLDQYLMGFRPPTEVPGTFVVTGSSVSPLAHPISGIPLDGGRLDIGVNDVIAAEGRRTPDSTVAQRHYRFAFILVVAQGSTPSDANVQQLETYRLLFPAYYAKAASNNATAETTLNRSLKLSLAPAAGVVAGGAASGTITVQTPPKTDLTVALRSTSGFAQFPPTVRIPAGATAAAIAFTGVKAGVDELVATPSDPAYETAYARVQVADAAVAKLVLVSGGPANPAATLVRVTDANGLPYPGAQLTASVSPGGTVSPAAVATDQQGQAIFKWNLDGTSASQLSITLAPAITLALRAGSGVPVVAAVVNAASMESGASPGALGTLYGANLAGGWSAQAAYPWPETLGGVKVLLGGTALPLLYVSDGQINFFVPPGVALGPATITVVTASGDPVSLPVTLSALQPGIFPGAILHAGTGESATITPMRAGDFIEIYCTGLGVTRIVNGLSVTAVTPTVFIGGVPVKPAYSGLAPGFTGLYQVNVQIPPGLAAGPQGVILSAGTAHSNEVRILVQ